MKFTFRYESPPISEVAKQVSIEAETRILAILTFRRTHPKAGDILSIKADMWSDDDVQ